ECGPQRPARAVSNLGRRAGWRGGRVARRHPRRNLPGARRPRPPAGRGGLIVRSPLVAMLWENWRLTRVEAALRLGLALVSGAAALLLADNGQSLAFWFLFMVFAFFYFSMARLNGGRFMDGYKPGFPLYLLYTR